MTTRTLVQALIELVRPELQVPGLILEEHARDSTCPQVKLTKQGRSLLLRPDLPIHACTRPDCHARSGSPNERAFPFFVPHKEGLTALCDYLLFYEPRREAAPIVFLCELKSGGTGGARTQLRNGKLLAEHLVRMTSLHGELHENPRVTFRGVVFTPRVRGPKPGLKGPGFQFVPDEKLHDLEVLHLPAGQPWDLDAMCAARSG